jgi:hypothetical protein
MANYQHLIDAVEAILSKRKELPYNQSGLYQPLPTRKDVGLENRMVMCDCTEDTEVQS